jgi:hypothetical protein
MKDLKKLQSYLRNLLNKKPIMSSLTTSSVFVFFIQKNLLLPHFLVETFGHTFLQAHPLLVFLILSCHNLLLEISSPLSAGCVLELETYVFQTISGKVMKGVLQSCSRMKRLRIIKLGSAFIFTFATHLLFVLILLLPVLPISTHLLDCVWMALISRLHELHLCLSL